MDSNEVNIDDLMKEREWKVRHEGGWVDEEGEEFMRDYLHLPQPPPRCASQLRERAPTSNPSLCRNPSPSQLPRKNVKTSERA